MEYFRRRPPDWRDDNRAAVTAITIASSMSGAKLKPEDLFDSLRVIKEQDNLSKEKVSLGQKFFTRFASRMTEELPFNV